METVADLDRRAAAGTGLKPTYEGWKPELVQPGSMKAWSLKPTYEGWKLDKAALYQDRRGV